MIFKRRNPTKEVFTELEGLCDILIKSSGYLKKRANSKDTPTYIDFIFDLEKKADQTLFQLKDIVLKSFILPLDKEDIIAIAENLDTIIDTLERVENRLNIYHLTPNDAVRDFSNLIVESSHNIKIGFHELSKSNFNSDTFYTTCSNLNAIESKGDKNHRKHLEKLMNDTKIDHLTLLKWREVYQVMEDTLNLCEKLAILFEEIQIKYS
jgi:uncharacterized protein